MLYDIISCRRSVGTGLLLRNIAEDNDNNVDNDTNHTDNDNDATNMNANDSSTNTRCIRILEKTLEDEIPADLILVLL